MLKFSDVFGEGLGQLNGEYKIRLDENVPPVQHAPRRVALRPQLKVTLGAQEAQGVIAQCNHTHQMDKLHGRRSNKKWKAADMS